MIKLAREKGVRVVDVMSKELFVLHAGTPLDQAAALLAERHVSGAPVVSSAGKPLGVVTRADLLDPGRQQLGAKVDDVMTRVVYGVRPTDPVLVAVGLMLAEKIHRVIVVDEHGQMVGIVTPMDVLRVLVQAEPHAPLEWVPLK